MSWRNEDQPAASVKHPELLVNYAKSFGTFLALLPTQKTFPCVVVLGLRNNSQGHPRGIEADFLQCVATAKEAFPGSWQDGEIKADGLRYDGSRIIVKGGGVEYWFDLDKNCPVTVFSCSIPPDEFARVTDPDLLAAFLSERPYRTTPLSLEMHVAQMHINVEKPARPASPQVAKRPLYDRPSTLRSLIWFLIGVALVYLGSRWLGTGMSRGVAVNFYGWAIVVLGAVLIVRRGLDLFFPPSRL
jgi:hypothetical protein